MENENKWMPIGEQYKISALNPKKTAMLTFAKYSATEQEMIANPSLRSHFDYIMVDQDKHQAKKGVYSLRTGEMDASHYASEYWAKRPDDMECGFTDVVKELGLSTPKSNRPTVNWERDDTEVIKKELNRALTEKYDVMDDVPIEISQKKLLGRLKEMGVDLQDVVENVKDLEAKQMENNGWMDFGSEKISDLNQDAELILVKPAFSEKERENSPSIDTDFDYVVARQLSDPYEDEKTYTMTFGTIDVRDFYNEDDVTGKSVEDLAPMAAMACRDAYGRDTYDMEIMDKPVLFQRLEDMGINVETVVERKEDLEDFKSPVVYHNQTKDEKSLILSNIRDMKPGDELTYTINLDKSDEKTTEKYRFACVDKDTLLRFDITHTNLVKANPHVQDEMIAKYKVRDLYDEDGVGKLVHWNSNWRDSQRIPMNDVLDIKINKNRFTKEEVETLKKGKAIDYNKVSERQDIPDKEDYLSYIVNRSNANTKYVHEAFMKGLRNSNLTNAEYNEAYGEIRETEREALKNHAPVISAICALREAAKEVTHEGLEGQKMAMACNAVANGLARGKGWEVSVYEAEKEHPAAAKYLDAVEVITGRFVEINKGIVDIVAKREQQWADKQTEALKQKQALNVKEVSPNKAPEVVVEKGVSHGKGRV